MAVMDILDARLGSALYAGAGSAAGVSPAEAQHAMRTLCPTIARQLKLKSEEDAGTFETLLDLIDGGGLPDDPRDLTDAEAVSDGNAVLDDIYGSRDAAISALRPVAGVPETALVKLAPISATAVLAALAKTRPQSAMTAAAMPAASARAGILSTILSALVKGMVQAVVRQLLPPRRRSTRYASRRRSSRPPARRRVNTPSIEDIFGEILGTARS